MKRCKYYPSIKDDTCICDAGSDVSGTDSHTHICSIEYSETCQWANEFKKDTHKIKIYAWADYTWYYADEIPDMDMFLQSNGLSDDYHTLFISIDHDCEWISKYIHDVMDGKF